MSGIARPLAIESTVERLAPHLRMEETAVAGGVAIDIGIETLRAPRRRYHVADLDLVARSVHVVDPGVTRDFLVSHYHVVGPRVPKFMIQLVDPVTRIRVDVFPDLVGSIGRARPVTIGARTLLVLSLEDILDHKLQTLSSASAERPVDPKHLRDAQTIAQLLGRTGPQIDAQWLAADEFGQPNAGCERCELSRSQEFPLARPHKIASLLDWPLSVKDPG